MSYQQAVSAGYGLQGSQLGQPPAPPESVTQVLDQAQGKLSLIEGQVDELIGRLFNFPRPAQTQDKAVTSPSTSERVMELRSQAIRINEALATVLEKL